MATTIKNALEQVKICLNNKQSFIVEAGAGSGKTWTLIESIKHILETQKDEIERTNKKIVCITYTNRAKDEIIRRVENNEFVLVLTIHEFLWSVIANHQKELKGFILEFNAKDTKKQIEDLESILKIQKIEYSQYGRKFEKGRIGHDDVLSFSSQIFKEYPKISTILINKYPYLFVDEYQDTEQKIIDLLLDDLLMLNKGKIAIGFFGDSMQKIYDRGIGEIPKSYINNGLLEFITKTENYRCSTKVIDLLNKIRTNLTQIPTGKNVEGSVSFIHCNSSVDSTDNYTKILSYLEHTKNWNINTDTKILLLTHKGIANKLGYSNLLALYDAKPFGKDNLLAKEERFSDVILNKIEVLVDLFESKNYLAFIKLFGSEKITINRHADKAKINDLMRELITFRKAGKTGVILDFVFENNIIVKSQKIIDYENSLVENESEQVFYNNLRNIDYKEFISLNEYINESTPYSTKHGVKGEEYKNVLVVIEDGTWHNYKFNNVLTSNQKSVSIYNRTLNLLYVCCSRAEQNLVIASLSTIDTNTITNWIGKENVISITDL